LAPVRKERAAESPSGTSQANPHALVEAVAVARALPPGVDPAVAHAAELPVAGDPHVTRAGPAVVTANPEVVRARGDADRLDDLDGGRDQDHLLADEVRRILGRHRRCAARGRESEGKATHDGFLLFGRSVLR